jgi:hypothetical protein
MCLFMEIRLFIIENCFLGLIINLQKTKLTCILTDKLVSKMTDLKLHTKLLPHTNLCEQNIKALYMHTA